MLAMSPSEIRDALFTAGSHYRPPLKEIRINRCPFVAGIEVLTDENAGRSDSIVGLFMYDDNTNGESELGALFSAPFIVGTDVFMNASEPAWIELEWNDPTNGSGNTTMRIPNWPSSTALNLVYFQ